MRLNTQREQDAHRAYEGYKDATHNSRAEGQLRCALCRWVAHARVISIMHETQRWRRVKLTKTGKTQTFAPNPLVPTSPFRAILFPNPMPARSRLSTGLCVRTQFDWCVQHMQAQQGVWYYIRLHTMGGRADCSNSGAAASKGLLPSCHHRQTAGTAGRTVHSPACDLRTSQRWRRIGTGRLRRACSTAMREAGGKSSGASIAAPRAWTSSAGKTTGSCISPFRTSTRRSGPASSTLSRTAGGSFARTGHTG